MALDTTVGGTASDSYVSLAEADTYFSARFGAEAYTDLEDADQEKALRQATREVDRHRIVGRRHYFSQALKFPRQYPYHREEPGESTAVEIPLSVKHATLEQALWICQNSPTGGRSPRQQLQNEGVTSFRVGSASETFGGGAMLGVLCPEARQLLSKWITRWGRIADDERGDFPHQEGLTN